jgi:hypothetical protein
LSSLHADPEINLLLILYPHWIATHIDSHLAGSITSHPLPFQYHCAVTHPPMLHLVELLQREIAMPQPLSRPFVESITTVLVIHLLAHQQDDGWIGSCSC